ncbi:DHA1 family purine ribonucleoside efflux pump-like MFS transporter [Acinetobacter calcoaceticus]|uniref:DHA1 family purine ribonucleoside efflux pump-like MFS transporter n=1 Tax=Acinetobacter calcoaceticus TaxID=471 RepID=A0A4R1XJ69_ACICA|nr:DHA1 family purine ribonucleoside efflux pump-like MFS transporter [Acinetobacter calcoaceticus]
MCSILLEYTDIMKSNPNASLRIWLAIFVLSFSCFVIVTTELAPMGLMTTLAQDFNQSEAQMGLIVSAYGGLAAIAALLSILLFTQCSRKWLLVSLMLLLATSSLWVAYSQSLDSIFWARGIGALAHGAFWALIGAVAYTLVPHEKLGLAMSIVFSGVSIASAFGVPIASIINTQSGWRSVFLILAVLALVCALMMSIVLPRIAQGTKLQANFIVQTLGNKTLSGLFLLTSVLLISHFAAFTFIEPYLQQVLVLDANKIAMALLCFGLFGLGANLLLGKYLDRYLLQIIRVSIVLVALCLMALGGFAYRVDEMLILSLISIWGAGIAVLFVALQTWVLKSAQQDANAASAIYVAIFNASIGLGALLGGQLIDALFLESSFICLGALQLLSLFLLARMIHVERIQRSVLIKQDQ